MLRLPARMQRQCGAAVSVIDTIYRLTKILLLSQLLCLILKNPLF